MPDYKKKNKKFSVAPKRAKTKTAPRNQINEQKQSIKNAISNNLHIVKGRKLERKRKIKLTFGLLSLLVAILLIFELLLPIGIVDSLENTFAKIGSGAYPIETEGGELVDVKEIDGAFLALTDTSACVYNSVGKHLIAYSHGFANPIAKVSSTRALIFEQGGKNSVIYNLSSEKSKIKSDNVILTGNISRCGAYALVTDRDQYASTVSVYNKNDKLIYEWYSAEDIVNNVVISPNGKKIAVSTVNAKGGQFVSKIFVFDFDSANPIYTETFESTVIYDLDSSYSKGFWCVSDNQIVFINWSNQKRREYKTEYSVSQFVADSGGAVAVFNRKNDKSDNKIVTFNKSGKLKNEFSFNGNISDISFANGHIYCISDTNIYILNKKGETIKKGKCSFGCEKMFVVGNYDIVTFNDNSIERVHIK